MILATAALIALQTKAAYKVEKIFTSTGIAYAQCVALNDRSQVLGILHLSEPPTNIPSFVWQDGKLTTIAPASVPKGAIYEVGGMAINNNGVVVGSMYLTADGENVGGGGFIWTEKGGLKELKAEGYAFEPAAINNKGEILGKAWLANQDDEWMFGVLRAKGFSELYTADWQSSWGIGLTDRGLVTGLKIEMALSSENGFRIQPGSQQPVALRIPALATNPDPLKKPTSRAMGANNTGWAAGFVNANATGDPLLDQIGGVWSPDNNFYSIGKGHRAHAINDKGQVVGAQIGRGRGHSKTSSMKTNAFICDSSGKNLRYLDTLVPKGSPHLVNPVSINNKGEILCEGESGWYLLRPTGK